MNESSRLIPSRMIEQSNEAIKLLQEDNRRLRVANQKMHAFINDNSINSKGFNNLKIKMGDYRKANDALIKANTADIIDHQKLIKLVGNERLIGSTILNRIEQRKARRNFLESRLHHYTRLRDNPIFWDNLLFRKINSGIEATARVMVWKYENLLDINNEILHNWEQKIVKYNEIEQATKELFTTGCELRVEAERGIGHIRQASAGLPNTFNSSALNSWRTNILAKKETVRDSIIKAITSMDRDKLIEIFGAVDSKGNLFGYNWALLRGLNLETISAIIKAIEGEEAFNIILQMVNSQKTILERDGIAWAGYEIELLLEQLQDYRIMQNLLPFIKDERFSPDTWASLSTISDREDLLREFMNTITNVFGVSAPTLNITYLESLYGSFEPISRTIELRYQLIRDATNENRARQAYRLFGTVIHELRHLYQFEAKENPERFMVSPPTLKAWEQNWGDEGSGYKMPSSDGWDAYLNQILEIDARKIQSIFNDWARNEHNLRWPQGGSR